MGAGPVPAIPAGASLDAAPLPLPGQAAMRSFAALPRLLAPQANGAAPASRNSCEQSECAAPAAERRGENPMFQGGDIVAQRRPLRTARLRPCFQRPRIPRHGSTRRSILETTELGAVAAVGPG